MIDRRPKILFLAHLLPWPLDGGGQIKSYHTLRTLAQVYDVTLLTLIRRPDEVTSEARAALSPYCRLGEPILLQRSRVRDIFEAFFALIGNHSFLVHRDWRRSMWKAVQTHLAQEEVPGGGYEALHIDHLQMMQFVPDNLTGVPKVILDDHNVEYRIPKRLSETPDVSWATRLYARIEWKKLWAFERRACLRADLVLTVSEEDRDALSALGPDSLKGKTVAVPIGVDLDYWTAIERSCGADSILSIGTMYWPPNVDAIRWFYAEMLPLIRRELPTVKLVVVGAKPTDAIRALGHEDPLVTVTGFVPDVRPYGARDGGVFIVPLRSGSGMRVKILTAMAMGLPVVSTTVGAEGIAVTDGVDIILADTPRDFADAVVGLLRDPERAERLGRAGKRLMERSYSWDAVGKTLLGAYERTICAGKEG